MYTELLAERLNLTPSTVSFHMKKPEEAGLAVSRKEQYYTVYSLNREVPEKTIYEAAVSEPEQADEQQKREGNSSGRRNPDPFRGERTGFSLPDMPLPDAGPGSFRAVRSPLTYCRKRQTPPV